MPNKVSISKLTFLTVFLVFFVWKGGGRKLFLLTQNVINFVMNQLYSVHRKCFIQLHRDKLRILRATALSQVKLIVTVGVIKLTI